MLIQILVLPAELTLVGLKPNARANWSDCFLPRIGAFRLWPPPAAAQLCTRVDAPPADAALLSAAPAEVESLLALAVAAGRLVPPLPVPDLAYLLVRIGESFVYTDVITGDAPDAEKAHAAVTALLT